MPREKWIGPFTIRELLDQAASEKPLLPPESMSAYVVSLTPWRRKPSVESGILYIGSNTGSSKRFRTRVGDLVADLFGFFGSETGHHSGGQSLHAYCRRNKIKPAGLYIGWLAASDCVRCTEATLFRDLRPQLNKISPSICKLHPRPNG